MVKGWTLGIFLGVSCLLTGNPVFAAPDVKQLYTQGEEAFQKGDYDAAIQSYEQAVEINPNVALFYNALGLAHAARNDRLSDVLWFFDVALKIDPQYAEAYQNKCRVLYRAGDYDLAAEACRKSLAISPDQPNTQLNLAWIYLAGKKQPQDAVFYFQKVLERTESPMVYFGLGAAYAMQGDNARVVDMITTLRGLGENNLAIQLENSIRKPEEVSPFPGDDEGAPMPRQEGTLIRAVPESNPALASPGVGGDSALGFTRIRLKGKLTAVPAVSNPSPADKTHPGTLGGGR